MGKALLLMKSSQLTERLQRMIMVQEHMDFSGGPQRGNGGSPKAGNMEQATALATCYRGKGTSDTPHHHQDISGIASSRKKKKFLTFS